MSDEWELPPSEIIVQDSLGEGAFGEVYKGILKGPITCSKVQPSMRRAVFTEVAIKLLKSMVYIIRRSCDMYVRIMWCACENHVVCM